MTRPVPDHDSAPWWQALAAHRLVVQHCLACDTLRWAPRALCAACGGLDWEWAEMSGRGTVATWTVSHRSFLPGRATPYVVVLARLAECDAILVPGGWVGPPDGTGLRVGLPVVADFTDLPAQAEQEEPAALLRWRQDTHAADGP